MPLALGEGQTALGGETSAQADVFVSAASVPLPRERRIKHLGESAHARGIELVRRALR
jgi:hypothetical protein